MAATISSQVSCVGINQVAHAQEIGLPDYWRQAHNESKETSAMKIVIFSPLATVAPHYETELEIIQRHLDDGDQVEMVACTGRLANCDFNHDRVQSKCNDCLGRRTHGLQLLDQRIKLHPLEAFDSLRFSELKTSFSTVGELIAYTFENFDVGYAVLSSLVSICRNPKPDLQDCQSIVTALFQSSIATYQQTLEYCRQQNPDRVYVFNGRFAATRAVLRACQSLQIDCHLHERGCDTDHYQLFENKLPHDIVYMQKRIRAAWNVANETERVSKATNWFHDRVNRVERSWHSFVKEQTRGQLPGNWDTSRRNITVFTSSEDEFVSIGDCWKNPLYKNQLDGLTQTVNDLNKVDPSIHLYVRIHPNLANVDDDSVSAIYGLASDRVTILAPDDPTDSYDLMRHSEKVVTFGSSIGIEAVFWNQPSILLGQCFYRGLGGVYQPDSHESYLQMLNSHLSPGGTAGALMYGHWFQTHGIKFKHFQAKGLFEGKFKGQVVFSQPKLSLPRRFRKTIKSWFRHAVDNSRVIVNK